MNAKLVSASPAFGFTERQWLLLVVVLKHSAN